MIVVIVLLVIVIVVVLLCQLQCYSISVYLVYQVYCYYFCNCYNCYRNLYVVIDVIKKQSSDIVKDIDLFEVYSGKGIPEGKKNLAFHIIYQSKKKTLLSDEIDKQHQKIVMGLERNKGFKVRK